MGEGGEETALSLFRFHLSPFPPETPDTQATIEEPKPTGPGIAARENKK